MPNSLKQKLGRALKQNEPLASHVMFNIGGPAAYFYIAKTSEELITALKTAEASKVAYFILGAGSNILVSDQGFNGLVIKPENRAFEIKGETVYAESGAIITEVLEATLKAGLVGWAWAAGLPGTIGGAIRGNAGAYGEAMSNVVTQATVYHRGAIKTLTPPALVFSYRHSMLKTDPTMVVLSATMQLRPGDVAKERAQVDAYNQRRADTQPIELPNAGCVFKNIDLSVVEVNKDKVKRGLDISEEEFQTATKFKKLPVSFIVDKLGLKGKQIGGAQVSEKHGAFIVNAGDATAEDVITLMSDIKMRARNQLGIQLQEEIQLVGF